MFKKKKISKNNTNEIIIENLIKIQKWYNKLKSKKNIFISLFWSISVFIVIIIWLVLTYQISKINFNLNNFIDFLPFNLNFDNEKINSNLKKSFDGKTNILIIGRWWEENDAPNLTDSIILASINYEKNTVSMFSVPRDMYVKFPTWWAWRINEVYFRWMLKTQKEVDWIKALKEVLTRITWEEIHYFVNLDFEWFKKIIDIIGWIDVNVPQAIVDTTYPGPNWWYQTFSIKAWPQTLDGDTALKYARSRHTTSDFDRSIRQQLIIKAIREKVLSLWILTSPSKIKSIYAVIKENIISDLDILQMINLALFVRDIPKENIISSNLNDSCFYGSTVCEKWWFLYVPLRADFGWASVLLQEWATSSTSDNYDSILKYTNIVFNYPLVYSENLKINIFNSTKIPGLANEIADKLKKYWFNIPSKNSVWNTNEEKYEKSKILYTTWTWWKKPETVEALENFIFGWSEKVEKLPKYSKNPDVKIEIIIWNDYKNLNF